MFSKACEYAIKASIFIAISSYNNKKVSPKEISEEIDSPKAFTAKILQELAKNEIIKSTKGPYEATSLFFFITLIALIDVIAGFSVTIRAARRDFAVGPQSY